MDSPELIVSIGGQRYHFSELPVDALVRLQSWIRQHVPHPIEAIKPHLAGLSDNAQAVLLDRAYKDAQSWPPQIGTQAGALALLGSESGQVEALYEGLRVHQPEITKEHARRVYKALDRMAASARRRGEGEASAERTTTRILSVIFGNGDPVVEDACPKE